MVSGGVVPRDRKCRLAQPRGQPGTGCSPHLNGREPGVQVQICSKVPKNKQQNTCTYVCLLSSHLAKLRVLGGAGARPLFAYHLQPSVTPLPDNEPIPLLSTGSLCQGNWMVCAHWNPQAFSLGCTFIKDTFVRRVWHSRSSGQKTRSEERQLSS